MLLTYRPLPLAATPRAVSDARRWVIAACRAMGRPDLADAAEMGTSELVTNALMHAHPPFSVQVRGTAEHPRIEISDGSPKPPSLPRSRRLQPDELLSEEIDLDLLLDTYGRGLAMVAMASVRWGASLESDSKVVWFEPAPRIDEDGGPDPVILEALTPPDPPFVGGETTEVHLLGIDPELFAAQRRQYGNLRRELRLLALAHEESYPLAKELCATFTVFEEHFAGAQFPEMDELAASRGQLLDVTVPMAAEAAEVCRTMVEMSDLADEFCRAQRLLSLGRTDAVRDFQTWLLGQVVAQLSGASPRPWTTRQSLRVG